MSEYLKESYVSKNKVLSVLLFFILITSVYSSELYNKTKKVITIDVTTHLGDVKRFIKGDEVSFLISLDRDAHVLLLYQNANKKIVQLLPNKSRQSYYLKAGSFIPVPEAGEKFIFKIEPPYGKEVLWVFAADTPFPDLPGTYRKDGLKKITQSIALIRKELMASSKKVFGEASYGLTTSAR